MKPRTVPEYIAAAPKPARAKLREMRALIAVAAPGATQSLKWGMPAFSYKRILVIFGAFKRHIGFFITPSVQLPLGTPLPRGLIKKIVAYRVKQERARDAKWRVKI